MPSAMRLLTRGRYRTTSSLKQLLFNNKRRHRGARQKNSKRTCVTDVQCLLELRPAADFAPGGVPHDELGHQREPQTHQADGR
jgi:hypothetical protein